MTVKENRIKKSIIAYMGSANWRNMTPDTNAKEDTLIFGTSGLHCTVRFYMSAVYYQFDNFGDVLFQSVIRTERKADDIGREIGFIASAISNCDSYYFKRYKSTKRA